MKFTEEELYDISISMYRDAGFDVDKIDEGIGQWAYYSQDDDYEDESAVRDEIAGYIANEKFDDSFHECIASWYAEELKEALEVLMGDTQSIASALSNPDSEDFEVVRDAIRTVEGEYFTGYMNSSEWDGMTEEDKSQYSNDYKKFCEACDSFNSKLIDNVISKIAKTILPNECKWAKAASSDPDAVVRVKNVEFFLNKNDFLEISAISQGIEIGHVYANKSGGYFGHTGKFKDGFDDPEVEEVAEDVFNEEIADWCNEK